MRTETIPIGQSRSMSGSMSRIRVISRSALKCLAIVMAVLSVLVMGSDGPYFPWFNLLGVGVLALCTWIIPKLEGKRSHGWRD